MTAVLIVTAALAALLPAAAAGRLFALAALGKWFPGEAAAAALAVIALSWAGGIAHAICPWHDRWFTLGTWAAAAAVAVWQVCRAARGPNPWLSVAGSMITLAAVLHMLAAVIGQFHARLPVTGEADVTKGQPALPHAPDSAP